MQFSTYEVDNDESISNCATDYRGNGGNWYNACLRQNLNGLYGSIVDEGAEFMSWQKFDDVSMNGANTYKALKSMKWMLREMV